MVNGIIPVQLSDKYFSKQYSKITELNKMLNVVQASRVFWCHSWLPQTQQGGDSISICICLSQLDFHTVAITRFICGIESCSNVCTIMYKVSR